MVKILKGSYEHKRASLRDTPFSKVSLEKKFLGGLVKYPKAARMLFNQFNSEFISSDKLKWIFDKLQDFHNKTGYLMDDDSFKEFCKVLKPKKRRLYTRLWKSIAKASNDTSESALFVLRDNLENLYHARLMVYNSNIIADLLDKVGTDGFEYVNKAKEQYGSIDNELRTERAEAIIVDPFETFKDFKAFHKKAQKNPKEYKGMPTGLSPLDRRMGGLRSSEFALIATRTGIGKSILLMEFATYCFINHGDVIYVTVEMPELQMRQRFYCHLSRIKYKFFRNFELSPKHWRKLDKTVTKRFKDHPHKMHIVDLPGSGTVKVIQNKIEEIVNRNNIKLVFIDYMNILQSSSGKIAVDWQSQVEVGIEIKQSIARYFGTGTWSAAQVNPETEGQDRRLRIKDMAFAKHIIDHLDIGIYVQDTDTTEEDEIFRMGFLKTRDFKADEFMVKADRDRMTFNVLSKKKQKEYREELGGGVEL